MIDSLKRQGVFYDRPDVQKYEDIQISPGEQKTLIGIKQIFDKHNTMYNIIITPLYDQSKFNRKDRDLIVSLFPGRVVDFSGKNEITEDVYNYPDRKHFQPYIMKNILDSIIKVPMQNDNRTDYLSNSKTDQ
jgi:hypothetical protein